MSQSPILVSGAAGRLGGVGGEVVAILRSKGLPVRALVRTDDDRAESLRATGAFGSMMTNSWKGNPNWKAARLPVGDQCSRSASLPTANR